MQGGRATAEIAVTDNGQAVTRRRQKPFGDPRGAAVVWTNPRSFVGGTADATGVVHLGAREYDPAPGRFLSSDPVFDATTPQQFAAYSYAGNSPVTNSDPSGLRFISADAGGGGGSPATSGGCGYCGHYTPPAN